MHVYATPTARMTVGYTRVGTTPTYCVVGHGHGHDTFYSPDKQQRRPHLSASPSVPPQLCELHCCAASKIADIQSSMQPITVLVYWTLTVVLVYSIACCTTLAYRGMSGTVQQHYIYE